MVNQLRKERAKMIKTKKANSQTETQPQSGGAPLRHAAHAAQHEVALRAAAAAARKAVDKQREAATRAQREAERKRAEAALLSRRVAALQAALESEGHLRRREEADLANRKRETEELLGQVSQLKDKLGKEAIARAETQRRADEARQTLESRLGREKEQLAREKLERERMEQMSGDLEREILALQDKIQSELEEKERIKTQSKAHADETRLLRAAIAEAQALAAEQAAARARAESKAQELSHEMRSKLTDLERVLEDEKRNKQAAEAEAAARRTESDKLKSELGRLEQTLHIKVSDLNRQRRASMLRHEAAQAAAAAARHAAEQEVSRLKADEEKAARKQAELQASIVSERERREQDAKELALRLAAQKQELARQAEAMRAMQESLRALEEKRRQDELARRSLHDRIQDLMGHVRVYCRLRPISSDAAPGSAATYTSRVVDGHGVLAVTQPTKSVSGQRRDRMLTFAFDRVLPGTATQADVFAHVQQLVTSSMDGFDVTLFAYGQTGSGKTYTMFGPPGADITTSNMRGVIPRTVEHIFDTIEKAKERHWEYELAVSMLEIYKDTIHDLFSSKPKPTATSTRDQMTKRPRSPRPRARSPRARSRKGASSAATSSPLETNNQPHRIVVDKKGRVRVTGLQRMPVSSAAELHALTRSAAELATRASTAMNVRSSRSHTVFQLHIHGRHRDAKESVESALTLVDLAGSERIAKSGAKGERLAEAKAINTSLSLLGLCVRSLADKSTHVPFRNSKLTYLLHGALSGTGKTAVIVNVASEAEHLSESLCTLRFADKLKGVPSK